MNRTYSHRKPLLRRTKSTPRDVLEDNAQKGLCATSLVGSAADISAVIAESLPEGKYCFIKSFFLAINKTAETLMSLRPVGGKAFVMIERRAALDLILTLVLAETKTSGVLDSGFDPQIEIRASHDELIKTAEEVKKLLTCATSTAMSIEEFQKAFDAIDNPEVAKQLLEVMSTKAATVRSSSGPVPLKLDNRPLKDLPSNRVHALDVAVTRGFDDHANTVTVMVRTLLDADPTLFFQGESFRILCLDPEQRMSLLLAQAAKKPVMVKVSLARVPIVASARVDILTTLNQITMLECEDAEQLKGMLIRQLQLMV